MKFKKIEISAFRIYNNPENAVFDFASNSGETADFVSLYAPNGFGKTSFYDAVEWGVTGSVNRFFIRNKELNMLEKNQSSQNQSSQSQIPLLRNSNLERDTYVKVFSNSDKNVFEHKIAKESKLPDLPLNKNADSHEFHEVILSQEWISAFLTEKNGDDRYKKFMEMPELSGINDYYLNLKHLLSFQDSEEKRMQSDIRELKKQIKKIEDQNLLETINLRIENINTLCSEKVFNPIRIETTSAELVVFKNLITTKQTHYESEIQSLTNKIDNLRIALTGSNELPSLKSFGDNKASFPKLISDIEEVRQLLIKFEEKEKITNELINLNQSLAVVSSKKEKIEMLLAKFNQFETIDANIKTKTAELNKLQISLPELNGEIDKLKKEELSLNEKLKSCLQQIEVNEGKKKTLPALKTEISDITKSTSAINIELEAQTLEIEPFEKSIKEKSEKSSEFETLRNQLQEGKYSKKYLEEKPELIELVDELNQSHTTLPTEKNKLDIINKKIEEQKDLNSTIQSFIEQGLAIVNENQSSKCPLCEHQYFDLTTLANKISKNTALSDVLKDLNNQKQALIESIRRIEETIKNGNQKFTDYYTSKIDKIATEVLLDSEAIDTIKKLIQEDNDKLETLRTRNAELSASMLGLTVEDYTNYLDDLILNGIESKVTITKSLTDFSVGFKLKQEFLEKQNGEITLLQNDIVEHKTNTDYVAVIDFFKTNYPSENINKGFVDNLLEEHIKDISSITGKIKDNDGQLILLNEKLGKFNKENLKIQESELELKKESSENEQNKYILFFKNNFTLNIHDLSDVDINQFIEAEDTKNTRSFKKCKTIHDELTMLEKNSLHISEFLQTENTKIQIQLKEKELSFLTISVRPIIEAERKKTKQFIEQRITNFLHEKLIDKLYNKIDPHPDFKKVKFTPNLDAEPPRLDVFVGNKDSGFIIPNLYFSTAQINILSLCIFLATALKSKKYDCIFIDDPIQSMDSINVLSTIDLLRSIVVNNGKQIIISTHDENFHNLLKKKMPAELFKSKFLKLESFGKVINDV